MLYLRLIYLVHITSSVHYTILHRISLLYKLNMSLLIDTKHPIDYPTLLACISTLTDMTYITLTDIRLYCTLHYYFVCVYVCACVVGGMELYGTLTEEEGLDE